MKNWFKIIFIIIIIILSSILLDKYGLSRLREVIISNKKFTYIGIFMLRFTSVIIPALPGTIYSISSGALLGFKEGFLTISTADLLSCSSCFFISRYLGTKYINIFLGSRMILRLQKFSRNHVEKNFFLTTGLLMTGFFDFVSYGIGLTNLSYKKFLISLLISIIISNAPVVALGAGLLQNGKIILLLSIIGIFVLSILNRKLVKYFKAN